MCPITFTHFKKEEENILTNSDNRFIRGKWSYEGNIYTVYFSTHGHFTEARPNGKQTVVISSPLHTSQCCLRLVTCALQGDTKGFLRHHIMETRTTATRIITLPRKAENLYFLSFINFLYCNIEISRGQPSTYKGLDLYCRIYA